ncbi:MAG: xanthine dehydrogenase family protein molybdopterin-binding subunit [Elusimicrobiota bacterium]
MKTSSKRCVGASVARVDAFEKLTGAARYVDDLTRPGLLHAVTLRSSVAHARLKGLIFDPAFPWHECVIVQAQDIPGKNGVPFLQDDQPFLAQDFIRHPQEPVALIAHPDRAAAYEALKHVSIDCEALPPVFDARDSKTCFKEIRLEKGDCARAFSESAFVVEGDYSLPHQEHAYIETQGALAYWEDDALCVTGSLQCPYYVLKALKAAIALPEHSLRVIQAATGGGFGGKEDYPNIIFGHAALLAYKAKRPVKLVYDRLEDMAATTKRHPAFIRLKTGLDREGRLLAQEAELLLDGGAYSTLSPVVLSRAVVHATGPYHCPNVRVRGRAAATNTPPNGAFRGFGAPQALFAVELHWEAIARKTGLDAVELRRKNALRPGSSTTTGQELKESVGALAVLDAALKKSRYARTRAQFTRHNGNPKSKTLKGVGLSLTHHGAGFTGGGELHLDSRAAVSLSADGTIRVLAGSTEIGQGSKTALTQICAQALGVPFHWICVENPDTSKVPDSGPTVASRTTMVVGGLVRQAALELKERLADFPGALASLKSLKAAARTLCIDGGPLRLEARYAPPEGFVWNETTYRGDAYAAYGFAATIVELEIDKATAETRVLKLTTAHEFGRAVNPLLAEGQIAGGALQGLGYALLEHAVFAKGSMLNGQLTNYMIPAATDAPPMEIVIVDSPTPHGPFGAKGLGELPMNGPAPAVAAAVHHATGRIFRALPIRPEDILPHLSNP